jgi:hypothetical protein
MAKRKSGNTTGTAQGPTAPGSKRAEEANPPAKPETPAEIDPIDALQLVLDLAGMIPGAGAVPDLLNAAISVMRGDFVGALFSAAAAIPVVGDAAGAARIIKNGDKYLQAIKVIEAKVLPKLPAPMRKKVEEYLDKVRKKIDEVLKKEAPDQKPAKSKDADGMKSAGKKKMKCGEYGRYGKLKQKTGDGNFDRDHIPSKAALKQRAQALLPKGKELSPKQAKAIDDWGEAIAIPRQAHIDISPTYGQSTAAAKMDSGDLAGSARRDVEAMLGKIDEYDADGTCKKAYQKAAAKVVRMDNAAYDEALKKILKTIK